MLTRIWNFSIVVLPSMLSYLGLYLNLYSYKCELKFLIFSEHFSCKAKLIFSYLDKS